MELHGHLMPAVKRGSFLLPMPFSEAGQPDAVHKWAVTPVWVLDRLPMQPKTRKFPSGNLPKIASTACVPSQVRKSVSPIAVATFAKWECKHSRMAHCSRKFPKFLPSRNLRKLACMGHIPLTPFALQNSAITPREFLNFYVQKHTAGYGILQNLLHK